MTKIVEQAKDCARFLVNNYPELKELSPPQRLEYVNWVIKQKPRKGFVQGVFEFVSRKDPSRWCDLKQFIEEKDISLSVVLLAAAPSDIERNFEKIFWPLSVYGHKIPWLTCWQYLRKYGPLMGFELPGTMKHCQRYKFEAHIFVRGKRKGEKVIRISDGSKYIYATSDNWGKQPCIFELKGWTSKAITHGEYKNILCQIGLGLKINTSNNSRETVGQ